MRQAFTTMVLGLVIALLPLATVSAMAGDATGAIGQAGRLIEAKSYSLATTLLEDLLPEANANDRRSILDLLHQAYEGLAREAKAAGNERAAAHFQDNIAIIDRSRGLASPPAKSTDPKRNRSPRQNQRPKEPMGPKTSA